MAEPDERAIVEAVLSHMPYGANMGVEIAALEADALVCRLPFDESLIGNTELPALHGGALASCMEIVAMLEVARRQLARIDLTENLGENLSEDLAKDLPVPVNVTVQYLRSADALDCHVRAEVLKLGRRSNTVLCRLWQGDESKPVASMTGVFVRPA
jgi:acyl-coenzyme A thioesterase PaaI-like protein